MVFVEKIFKDEKLNLTQKEKKVFEEELKEMEIKRPDEFKGLMTEINLRHLLLDYMPFRIGHYNKGFKINKENVSVILLGGRLTKIEREKREKLYHYLLEKRIGLPDFIGVNKENQKEIVFIEVKQIKGKLRNNQKEVRKELEEMGYKYIVVSPLKIPTKLTKQGKLK